MIGPMAITSLLLKEIRLVTASPTATTQLLSGKDDYFFRVTSTTREYAT